MLVGIDGKSSVPRTHVKKPGMVVFELFWGHGDRHTPEPSEPFYSSLPGELGSVRDPAWGQCPRLT